MCELIGFTNLPYLWDLTKSVTFLFMIYKFFHKSIVKPRKVQRVTKVSSSNSRTQSTKQGLLSMYQINTAPLNVPIHNLLVVHKLQITKGKRRNKTRGCEPPLKNQELKCRRHYIPRVVEEDQPPMLYDSVPSNFLPSMITSTSDVDLDTHEYPPRTAPILEEWDVIDDKDPVRVVERSMRCAKR